MNFLPFLEAKRDGAELLPADIAGLVQGFTRGDIPDYQMAAWLMAVFFRGQTSGETRALTLAMRDSGEQLSFGDDGRPVVDKHSTGGVGDKVSLPLAPLLACLGFRVPMISGRGLGLTGGTLDKMDSIPGFQTLLTPDRLMRQVNDIGCAIVGQTEQMVPADRAIYALRDATATVPSIPLITASILSKKLAEGLDALVMDVKFGSAAFMRDLDSARELARSIVQLSGECGVACRALLTDMNAPLGRAAGNWLEVREAVECLEGHGPNDLRALVIECAASLLLQTASVGSEAEGRERAASCLASGEPREKWNAMLRAQGADLPAFEQKLQQGPMAGAVAEVRTEQGGFVTGCDARQVGELVRDLGGGRQNKDSVLDYEVGVDGLAQIGERVAAGGLLGRVHARDAAAAQKGGERLQAAFGLLDDAQATVPLVVEVVT